MELTGIRNTRLYGAESWEPGGAWEGEACGVTILALKQRMKWAPPLCPVLVPRSLLAKIETENSYVHFDNLVWKNNFFLPVPWVRRSISSMRRATCALGNNEKNQLSAKFAQFPLPLHHSRLRQDHYDQVFVSHSSPPGKTNTSIWCNVYVKKGKSLTWFQ